MKIKFTSSVGATLLMLAGIFPTVARAANVSVVTADGEIVTNNLGVPVYTGNNTGGTALPGAYYQGSPLHYIAPVLLPSLGPGTFSNVSFTAVFNSLRFTPDFNVDIYGISGTRPAPALTTSDASNAGTDGTLIADDFWTALAPPTPGTAYTTSAASAAVFSSWLNAQYADGANAGSYAFVRFSPDVVNPSTNSGYNLRTADNADPASRPFLSYDFTPVPEPSATALSGLVAVGLLTRRKRHA